MKYIFFGILAIILLAGFSSAQDTIDDVESVTPIVDADLGASREGSRTDDEVVQREEEAIKLDGLNVAQMKQLREQAENFTFQAEVNRMMKLIINSLYRNKEIYLRELISNASDALDKIRLLSLTDKSVLDSTPEFSIRIKADKDGKMLHITDTGIGMTKNDLVNNLGTIAKSGTAEFLSKMQDAADAQDLNDMIGQFGVGFYSAFLVADRVIVTTKHNDDKQYIWESDANSFRIMEDPRGNTLKRGTTVSLQLKPEAVDFLETDTIMNLVKKYSQFINFPIYLWSSKTMEVEADEDEVQDVKKKEERDEDDDTPIEKKDEDDAEVEDAVEEKKKKKVEKTFWDWELVNSNKPIWSRKPSEIADDEYNEFYKALTKDSKPPLTKVHFIAEGEVTFKALLFVPGTQPDDSFQKYGAKKDNIKLYVRRVFITDEFNDMMPNYLSFIQGVVDSDDLPLNVSRETLQQHKLIKVIKKKLIRKALDMVKKLPQEEYAKFWKEYSTNIKLGIIEDASNRSRLAKLLMFNSSHDPQKLTTLSDYVTRMKPKQERIYYLAGITREEVASSPFVERLLKKGYEVLYLTEAVDEYALSAIPEFNGKKFQNVAKEGFSIDEDGAKENLEKLKSTYKPLLDWLSNDVLKDQIAKAEVSERLSGSPCALVASLFGWTGNMERLATSNAHQKADDPQRSYYLNQKKTMEVNPRHPLIKELLRRVESDKDDIKAKEMATMLFRTATLRSGYMLKETAEFAATIETMMRQTLGVPLDEKEDEDVDTVESTIDDDKEVDKSDRDDDDEQEHDEL